MPSQRAALPVPAEDLSRARAELAARYGSTIVDGEDKRVLVIRVPHAQPDPVNDVELAVDFLQPGDVEDITHCLLVGDQAIAQVYARPLQDLMRQRQRDDREVAMTMRQRMGPGAHELFQVPGDPRKRWRLAVRLPAVRLAEATESMFNDLFDVLGPQLDTPRMRSLCAVYLISDNDEARLEPDLFLQDVRRQWEDEDRRRRAELETAQRAEAERRAKEEERRRLVAEMDRRLGRSAAPHHEPRRASHIDSPATYDSLAERSAELTRPRPRDTRDAELESDVDAPLADHGIPILEAESTITARPTPRNPGGPWAAQADAVEAPEGVQAPVESTPAPGPDLDARATHRRSAVPQARSSGGTARTEVPPSERGRAPDGLSEHIEGLRQRVEGVLDKAAPMPDPRPSDLPWRDSDRDRRARNEPRARYVPRAERKAREAPMPDPRPSDMPWRDSDRDRRWSVEARGDMARHLEAAGFDVLYDPPAGLGIDLAAERPDGDPQRLVVRCAPELNPAVARGLLKTARELDVDVVLCMTDKVLPEAERILVATKVRVVRPEALDRMPL